MFTTALHSVLLLTFSVIAKVCHQIERGNDLADHMFLSPAVNLRILMNFSAPADKLKYGTVK